MARRRVTRPATLEDILSRLRAEMPRLRKEYNVRSLSVFGSYVRGEQKKRSDVDVLVEYEETPDLLELISLEHHLSDLLGVKVDLVSRRGLRGRIGERILREEVPV